MNRFYIVIILGFLVYFSNLGGTSIYILDEAKNAGCAMEMMQRGDWIVPTFNAQLRTDKPPLHYYFMRASYVVGGITPFAARFFSAVAGLLMVIVVYKNVRRLLNESVAFYSALVILSSIQLTIQFHLAVPDPYLILFTTVSLFSFFNGMHHDTRQFRWLYVASALGFLTKGLIAVVLPGCIILFYLFFTGSLNWASLKKMNIPTGILIFFCIALPWYAAVGYQTNGEWLKGFFLDHNLSRYTSTMEGHRGFPLAPFVILIVGLLPFSVYIVQAVRLTVRERREHPLLLFCLITGLVFATFFSFSKTILPSYPAPAIPFLAICIGYFLHRIAERQVPGQYYWISFLIHLIISAGLCIAAYYALVTEESMSGLTDLVWIFVILPVGSLAGWYFFIKKQTSFFLYSWCGSWILLVMMFFYVAYPRIDARNPVSASLPLIRESYPDYQIVAYHIFNPAYVFALHRTFDVVNSPDELEKFTTNGKKVLIITRKKYIDELSAVKDLGIVYSGKDLFESNETVLLAN